MIEVQGRCYDASAYAKGADLRSRWIFEAASGVESRALVMASADKLHHYGIRLAAAGEEGIQT
jgi:hypothetical protein